VNLNQRAFDLCREICGAPEELKVAVHDYAGGGTVVDMGIEAPGGLDAGIALAEVCLAGLGRVSLVPAERDLWQGPAVAVQTDHPMLACIAAQYAGWKVAKGKFFAMGSGPMRAAAGKEELFERIGYREQSAVAVGVLETSKLPPPEVVQDLAQQCGVPQDKLMLLVAPTASQAGTLQVVARSIETTLHKLFELGFDLNRVESGWGVAPLPPVAANDLAGIGRTNDAILYGGEVTLWVRGDDASLEATGPKIPSNASADHGEPFGKIFERYERDFYRIDPHLFSPAVVTLVNLDTGRSYRYGQLLPEVIQQSFST
jgi:methenyltetrahydromethanopterin cyclohydrolase